MDVKKQFSLTKPCPGCPFRADGEGIRGLQPGRRSQIIMDLVRGNHSTFHCHQSVYRGNKTAGTNDRHHCPGAIAVVRMMGSDTQAAQIATRLRVIPPDHYDDALLESMSPDDLD
jgi:hypothetical protein